MGNRGLLIVINNVFIIFFIFTYLPSVIFAKEWHDATIGIYLHLPTERQPKTSGFCTGAHIRGGLVVTASHCLHSVDALKMSSHESKRKRLSLMHSPGKLFKLDLFNRHIPYNDAQPRALHDAYVLIDDTSLDWALFWVPSLSEQENMKARNRYKPGDFPIDHTAISFDAPLIDEVYFINGFYNNGRTCGTSEGTGVLCPTGEKISDNLIGIFSYTYRVEKPFFIEALSAPGYSGGPVYTKKDHIFIGTLSGAGFKQTTKLTSLNVVNQVWPLKDLITSEDMNNIRAEMARLGLGDPVSLTYPSIFARPPYVTEGNIFLPVFEYIIELFAKSHDSEQASSKLSKHGESVRSELIRRSKSIVSTEPPPDQVYQKSYE